MPRSAPVRPSIFQPSNLITLSGLFSILVLVGLVYRGVPINNWLGSVLLVYGYRVADELDGRVARFLGQQSIFGELLDLYVDRANDCLLAALVILISPQLLPAIAVFGVAKLGSEHVLGRVIGLREHKDARNTGFSTIYTLFHNFWVLQFYLLVKLLFFLRAIILVPIPYIEYGFVAVVLFRGLYILQLFGYLSARTSSDDPISKD